MKLTSHLALEDITPQHPYRLILAREMSTPRVTVTTTVNADDDTVVRTRRGSVVERYGAFSRLRDTKGEKIVIISQNRSYNVQASFACSLYAIEEHNNYDIYDNEDDEISFLNNAIEAISQIASGAFGAALVEYLIQSDQTITITEGNNRFNASDASIGWNPNNYDGGISNDPVLGYSSYRSPQIGLSHELGHAADYVYGTLNTRRWNELKNNDVTYSERTAILMENLVRKEHRHAPRFYYQDYAGLPIVESHINNMPGRNHTIIQILYNRSMIKQAPTARDLINSAIRTILK